MKASAIFLSVAMASSALANPAKRSRCGYHGAVSTTNSYPAGGSTTSSDVSSSTASSASGTEPVTATEDSTVTVVATQTATTTVDVVATTTTTVTTTVTPEPVVVPTPIGFEPINPDPEVVVRRTRALRGGLLKLAARQNSTAPFPAVNGTMTTSQPPVTQTPATTLTRLTTDFVQTTATVTATRTVSTSTVTETVTVTAATPTTYAACAADNYLSQIDGETINSVTDFGSSRSIMLQADNAQDCCAACMKDTECAISYFDDNESVCYGAKPQTAGVCDAADHIADASHDSETSSARYTISNGKCGQWTTQQSLRQ